MAYILLNESGVVIAPPIFAVGSVPDGYIEVANDDSRIFTYGATRALVDQARAALTISDKVATRCLKAGVTYPSEWQSYDAALRDIVNTASGSLPSQPAYPAGT